MEALTIISQMNWMNGKMFTLSMMASTHRSQDTSIIERLNNRDRDPTIMEYFQVISHGVGAEHSQAAMIGRGHELNFLDREFDDEKTNRLRGPDMFKRGRGKDEWGYDELLHDS